MSFIRRAQEVGFSLDEKRTLLDDQHRGWRGLVDHKIDELVERRDRLDVIVNMLIVMSECGCEVAARCPKFATC